MCFTALSDVSGYKSIYYVEQVFPSDMQIVPTL